MNIQQFIDSVIFEVYDTYNTVLNYDEKAILDSETNKHWIIKFNYTISVDITLDNIKDFGYLVPNLPEASEKYIILTLQDVPKIEYKGSHTVLLYINKKKLEAIYDRGECCLGDIMDNIKEVSVESSLSHKYGQMIPSILNDINDDLFPELLENFKFICVGWEN